MTKPTKRFVTIAEYKRISGLSYATVNHMLNSGQLPFITTESGQRRVDTYVADTEQEKVMTRLDSQERLLKAICTHLGVK